MLYTARRMDIRLAISLEAIAQLTAVHEGQSQERGNNSSIPACAGMTMACYAVTSARRFLNTTLISGITIQIRSFTLQKLTNTIESKLDP